MTTPSPDSTCRTARCRSRWALVAAPLLLASVLGACGSTQSSAKDHRASPSVSTITIKDFTFSPNPVEVKAGQTVRVKNTDTTTAHTVTADDMTFDTGNVQAGSSTTFKAPKVGSYPFHCNIHADMHGTLKVTK